MINTIIFDLSRVILHPADKNYTGTLEQLRESLNESKGKFYDHFSLNEELLDFLEGLKENLNLYIFTSSPINELPELVLILETIFKKIYTTKDLGLKTDPESYISIVKELKVNPENILFIDDSLENLESAKKVGLTTIQYNSNEKLFKEFGKIVFDLR